DHDRNDWDAARIHRVRDLLQADAVGRIRRIPDEANRVRAEQRNENLRVAQSLTDFFRPAPACADPLGVLPDRLPVGDQKGSHLLGDSTAVRVAVTEEDPGQASLLRHNLPNKPRFSRRIPNRHQCSRFPGPLARQTRGADRYQHLGNPNAWSRAPRDEPQNLLEHLPCYGDLGHLEDKIEAVAHHLRADLDQLVLQGRLWRPQRPQEIGEVVGERMKLEPYDVGGERLARQPRPFDPALAFLDPLLARAALL